MERSNILCQRFQTSVYSRIFPLLNRLVFDNLRLRKFKRVNETFSFITCLVIFENGTRAFHFFFLEEYDVRIRNQCKRIGCNVTMRISRNILCQCF